MPQLSFTSCPDPRYKFLRSLGSGSYGSVGAFRDVEGGVDVAIKRIPQASEDFLVCRRTLREVKLMRHFHHKNLLHLVDVLPIRVNAGQVFVVTPLMDWDLEHMVRKRGKHLSNDQVSSFLAQLLLGLLHLHSGHVIHRDLKPANIFIRRDGLLKIGDLGLSRGIDLEESGERSHPGDEALTEYVVTRWYRAPEVILMPSEYGPPVDVWSVGCILYEMVTGKVLFQGRSSFDQLRRIVGLLGTPSGKERRWLNKKSQRSPRVATATKMLDQINHCRSQRARLREQWVVRADSDLAGLMERMMSFDPDERPSLEEALEDPCIWDSRSPGDAAAAKEIAIFPQDYDKEFDGLERRDERRALPDLVELLCKEVENFRANSHNRCNPVARVAQRRTSSGTPPRRRQPPDGASESRNSASGKTGRRASSPPGTARVDQDGVVRRTHSLGKCQELYRQKMAALLRDRSSPPTDRRTPTPEKDTFGINAEPAPDQHQRRKRSTSHGLGARASDMPKSSTPPRQMPAADASCLPSEASRRGSAGESGHHSSHRLRPDAMNSLPSKSTARGSSARGEREGGAFMSAAARGHQRALQLLAEDLDHKRDNGTGPSGVHRAPSSGAAHGFRPPSRGRRSTEDVAPIETEDFLKEAKRQELLAARAEATRREHERAAKHHAGFDRADRSSGSRKDRGEDTHRHSEPPGPIDVAELRAAQAEAIRRERERERVRRQSAPYDHRRGDVEDDVVATFLRGL